MALPQVVTKTYSRRSRHTDVSRAEQAFDEVFHGIKPPARATSTVEKWGTASFKRVTNDVQSTSKRKLASSAGDDDPFSFDSDDDGSSKKLKKETIKQKLPSPVKHADDGLRKAHARGIENAVVEKASKTVNCDKTSVSTDTVRTRNTRELRNENTDDKLAREKMTRCQTAMKDAPNCGDNADVKFRLSPSAGTKVRLMGSARITGRGDLLEVDDRNGLQSASKSPSPTCKKSLSLSPSKTAEQLKVFVDNFSQLISSQRSLASKRSLHSTEMDSSSSTSGQNSPQKNLKNIAASVQSGKPAHWESVVNSSTEKSLPDCVDNASHLQFRKLRGGSSIKDGDQCTSAKSSSLPDSSNSASASSRTVHSRGRNVVGRASRHSQKEDNTSPECVLTNSKSRSTRRARNSKLTAVSKTAVLIDSRLTPSLLSCDRTTASDCKASGDHVTPECGEPASIRGTSTRRLLTSSRQGALRAKAVYNPRQWNDSSEPELNATGASSQSSVRSSSVFDDFDSDLQTPPLYPRDPVASSLSLSSDSSEGASREKVKVFREHKLLYTVVRNVKEAHECQEYGETQEFCDDIEYILDGLGDTQPVSTRCLSAVSLASKCSASAFRMHIRAHDIFTKMLAALHDSPQHPSLALCTSAVMYMMSRDHLAMHIDATSLQLMLRLLSLDDTQESTGIDEEYFRIRQRIHDIVHEQSGARKSLTLDNMTPGHLAMETLLSLTSKQAGDWFKETLRTLGGLDQIVSTVCRCVDVLQPCVTKPRTVHLMTEQLHRVERCIRVLESGWFVDQLPSGIVRNPAIIITSLQLLRRLSKLHKSTSTQSAKVFGFPFQQVTYMNVDNQTYLLSLNSSELLTSIHRLLQLCVRCLPMFPTSDVAEADATCSSSCRTDSSSDRDLTGSVLSMCLLTALRLLLNVTHENESACTALGKLDGMLSTVLTCTQQSPQFLAAAQRFDLIILGIGLLTNLVERSEENRRLLIQVKSKPPYDYHCSLSEEPVDCLEALGMLFSLRYEAAKSIEEEQEAEIEEAERRRAAAELHSRLTAPSATTAAAKRGQKGEWQESDSGMFWEPAETSVLDSSSDGLAALHAARQEAAALAGTGSIAGSQDDDQNYTKVLHTAGRHMEDSIMAAYIALLIGSLIQHKQDLAENVRETLPGFSFSPLVQMLSKFLGFMNLTNASGMSASKSIQHIIEVLESY